jgi:hypothetical protein
LTRLLRRSWVALFAVVVILTPLTAGVLAQESDLDAILSAAGAYLARYTQEIGGVVAEEDYAQQVHVRFVTTRQLKSDLLIMADPTLGWIEFRDVFEVDGKPVRDRTDRLAKLFEKPNPDAMAQARRIVAEGARLNLDAEGLRIDRTINLPLAALMFLRTRNQPRSRFAIDSYASVDGHRTAVVKFQETAMPRLIGSASNGAASGEFWVEPDSGRVLRTRLDFTTTKGTSEAKATIQVDFREEPKLEQWLPHSMDEHYAVISNAGPVGTVEGQASYVNYRQFSVAVDASPQ